MDNCRDVLVKVRDSQEDVSDELTKLDQWFEPVDVGDSLRDVLSETTRLKEG